MVRSRLNRLKLEMEEQRAREQADKPKVTYEELMAATGLSASTLARLFSHNPVERIDGKTISALCKFFGCGVGELLEYVADEETN